ncbi:MAG TPA: cation diffusion facilitator family transporter [bacterium]|jgi:cobalt-zinc-cadmium efflux system protein|nr:cation transporter [Dictyoglomota bacterium]HHV80159.1 cation transporter [bacterium]HOP55751.1 cation diffusion facilitator family transporter [bacterium]
MHAHNGISRNNLLVVTVLNFSITAAEMIGGMISGSLSLISDALHNLSDGVAILISYLALKISQRDNNERLTFGYKRVEILSALFNSVVLLAISISLFREAYIKIKDPQPIDGLLMIIVALIGLLANFISVLILRGDSQRSLNIRGAYVHLLSDTLSSVGVVIGGILIYFYKIYFIDPILTFLIGAYIIKECLEIVGETVEILMQATPRSIDINRIKEEIESLEEVKNVHHVHIWRLDDNDIHFEGHINLKENLTVDDTIPVYRKIEDILKKYNITHSTLQMEYECCEGVGLITK